MAIRVPILLNFSGLANEEGQVMLYGQLTYTKLNDLSFKNFGRRKTFRTLVQLYQTKPFANQTVVLVFDKGEEVEVSTNLHGGFRIISSVPLQDAKLIKVTLKTGVEVKLIEGLYPFFIHRLHSESLVVSDIDDTLMHSFIAQKVRKFKTLMLTRLEKRKAVIDMREMVLQIVASGSHPIYLSNSEQNLYPLIFRFLIHNGFPSGPVFLKNLRSLVDVIRNIKLPLKNMHKIQTLEELIAFFPTKKFILIGDNTQQDLHIYVDVAKRFHNHISHIIIRQVINHKKDHTLIEEARQLLEPKGIKIYFDNYYENQWQIQ